MKTFSSRLVLGIYGYVILKDGVTESDDEIIRGLRNIVRNQIGSFAVPELLLVTHSICMCLS